MKNLLIALLIPLTLLSGINLHAQEDKSRREKKADKYFFAYNYKKAIDIYERTDDITVYGKRNLAESYRKSNDNLMAEEAYRDLIFTTQGAVAEDYYHYAMVLKANEKYTESFAAMDQFASMSPGDLRVKSYLENRGQISQMLAVHESYKIQHPEMNKEDEDFATNFYGDSVVFASTRDRARMIKRLDNHTHKPYLDIYAAEMTNDNLENTSRLDKDLRTKYHDGPASFSNDNTLMAYTKNHAKDKSKDKVVELQIWFRDLEDGEWGEERPFVYNSERYSVGHPFLLEDGQTMYFASNMEGGYGGADIYRTTKDENGDWTTPVNLGPTINTEGNDMFPFFEEENEVLFFASDGHFGLGGLDIFMAPSNNDKFGRVYNPGAPVNTPQDDFNMVINEELRTGYFSSNRDRESDDIYSFDVTDNLAIGNKIVGTAYDEDGKPLAFTFVALLDDNGTMLQSMTTEQDGKYSFLVPSDSYYRLVGTKENYQEGTAFANTFGDEFIVQADIILPFRKEVIVSEDPTVVVDFGNAVYFNPIYFDLDKYNIRPDAAAELNKIVQAMNENPNMKLRLSAHADSRASQEYNQVLSEKRAQASAEYIKARITNPERVSTEAHGETQLVNGCVGEGTVVVYCDENDHQKNRRTEFVAVTK